ncbi:MAG: glycosyl hydrolase [Eubacteriales bacterium]|nr:glycosyl hydrolase [Eubacteriales bacterium]
MKLKKIMALLLVTAVLASNAGTVLAAGDTGILNTFQDCDLDTKPMARMWFIDAMAGSDENDVIEEMIQGMAEGGMGGVELAFLSDNPSISDVEFAKEYGWGSENWIKVLKKVFQAALKVEDGFKVDMTITSHWPPALNTIDPNDTAASQEMSSSITYITQEDLDRGSVTLNLPETKTEDGGGNPFVFTDTLVSAVAAGSCGEKEVSYTTVHPMMGESTTTATVAALSYDNMQDVTGAVTASEAYKAGVPDEEALQTWYDGKYSVEDVSAAFGEAPQSDAELADGKRTQEGLRARMADTQYSYTLDLTGLDLQEGDAVAGVFYRGTGQIRSGGGSYTMPYITYATNYFAQEGIQTVIDYWNNHILSDSELVELMAANAEKTGGLSIFEDSIEASHSTPFWSNNMLSDGTQYLGYDFTSSVPLILSSDSSTPFVFVNEEGEQIDTTRVVEDYDSVLTELFNSKHMKPVKEWMDSLDFDVDYRIQAYGIESMGYVAGALTAGIPEGDNATAGDDDRMLSTAVNLNAENNLLSQEALTTIKQQLTWKIAASDVNNHSSSGINRVIFHGSSYPVCFDEGYNSWPGWNWGGMKNYYEGFNSWNSRTAWWNDAETITDYVSRLQAVSQNGTAKCDLAIMTNRDGSDSTYEALLNSGYSYNIMDEEVFKEELVDPQLFSVTDGVLCADTAGYRAMLISDLEAISVENLTKIVGFAENGLPIIVQGTIPARTYGTASEDEDAQITDLMNQLTAMENVSTAETVEEALSALDAMNVTPAASYSCEGIETTLRREESGNYYKLYNNSGEKAEFTVTLSGDGIPYKMNTWDGSIEPIAAYTKTDTGVALDVSIEKDEMLVIAVAPSEGEVAKAAGFAGGNNVSLIEEVKEETADNGMGGFSFGGSEEESLVKEADAKYVDGQLVLRSTAAKDYNLTTENGEIKVSTPETKSAPELYDWTLTLNSYGPDEEANKVDPTVAKITTVEIDHVAAGTAWAYLPTTYAEEFGVDNMNAISGTGIYKTTITMPEDWNSTVDGAYLALTYCENDMLASVTVNGQEISDLNALRDYVDLGHLLQAGENEITIQIDTTLVNRGQYEGGQARNPMDQRVDDGLMSAEIITYTDTVIE